MKEWEWPRAGISFLSLASANPSPVSCLLLCGPVLSLCSFASIREREKKKGEMKVSGRVGHTVPRAVMEWEKDVCQHLTVHRVINKRKCNCHFSFTILSVGLFFPFLWIRSCDNKCCLWGPVSRELNSGKWYIVHLGLGIAGKQNLQQETNNKTQGNKLGGANCCCCSRCPALWPARCSLCCCGCLSALDGEQFNEQTETERICGFNSFGRPLFILT